jgi:hypothetical protein
MASLDDILTTQKNGVVAINSLTNNFKIEVGTITSSTVTASTLVITGRGKISNISVVVPGTVSGFIYNATADIASLKTDASRLLAIPITIGVFQCGILFTDGIVISPGTGQALNVTYTLG